MRKKRGFTLIELLVVIAIIALLMSILMPALAKVKKIALAIACMGNMKQWGIVFSLYTNNNNNFFHRREIGSPTGYSRMWLYVYEPWYKDPMLRYCPTATNREKKTGPFGTWNFDLGTWEPDNPDYCGPNPPYDGSYGMNRFVADIVGQGMENDPAFFRRTDVKGADRVPVFSDCQYGFLWPGAIKVPPAYDGDFSNEMQWWCINRHMGYVNMLFLDFSVRKVGLKEIWTLKCSTDFDTCNVWTVCSYGSGPKAIKACGAAYHNVAEWMDKYPVY